MSTPTPTRSARSRLSPDGQDLVVRYLPLARSLARPMKAHWPNVREDFDSTACLALVEAAESFDPERNIKFGTFARYRIVGALRDLQRTLIAHRRRYKRRDLEALASAKDKTVRHGRPAQLFVYDDPNAVGSQVETIDMLEDWLRKLPVNHAHACRLLFLAGKTQVEAATMLGLSQSRMSTLRREALERIREMYEARADDAA